MYAYRINRDEFNGSTSPLTTAKHATMHESFHHILNE